MTGDIERDLDVALTSERPPADPDVAEMVDVARRLGDELAVDAPGARRERAMFVQGVAGRRRRRPPLVAIALRTAAAGVLLIAVAWVAQNAAPGQRLYPVKEALRTIGLAPSVSADFEDRVRAAGTLLEDAAAQLPFAPQRAERLSLDALGELARAQDLLDEERGPMRAQWETRIEQLERRAVTLLRLSGEEADDDSDDDSSGSGSDDDDSDDDSSGRGSDDDSDDSDDDSSGRGSDDDDDSDDDSSRRGSDDDDSDDSGSDDDDSSGRGSGGDDSDDSGGGSDDD
ncbi:MAG TPA: hypothetical protein VHJ34_14455 [Actinomycetota bacterium]|nr:hypothetical protein [Actinomycetota bacterium]